MGATSSKQDDAGAASPSSALPPCRGGQEYFASMAKGGDGAPAGAGDPSSCPVLNSRAAAVYNVYAQRINDPDNPVPRDPLAILERLDRLDPSNQMPLEPNQQPCPGQRVPLSTERQASSIPKGGTSSTWLYPSPQMFYNSLKRKGKGEDVHEAVMDSIVASHNGLNEQTWRQVLVWESLHRGECGAPKLVRFMGKPHDMSPLARWRVLVGGPAPFDRHDWWVDRCGEEVRYVIDFYFDEARAGSPEAFEVVARPALDSFSNVLDRVKMSIYTTFAEYGLPCPVTLQGGRVGQEAQRSRQPSTA